GSVSAAVINPFVPSLANADSFSVVTYASRSGSFASYHLFDNGTVALAPYYAATAFNLTAVISGTTIFWVNGSGGDWDTAANWSTGVVPVSTDNAFISISSSAVITHNTSASDTVNKLTSYESLSIANGTLTILGTSTIYVPLRL